MLFIIAEPYTLDTNWRKFRFPYRIGIPCLSGQTRIWRYHELPLTGDLPDIFDVFGINSKLVCLGNISTQPIDRIDVANRECDVLEVQLATGYTNAQRRIWDDFEKALSRSFCLSVKL